MLFLFAFFFGGFPLSYVVLNFISRRCTGILRFYGQSLSRLTYKRNCKTNSKLLTSQDPGITGSYKQALYNMDKVCNFPSQGMGNWGSTHARTPQSCYSLLLLQV